LIRCLPSERLLKVRQGAVVAKRHKTIAADLVDVPRKMPEKKKLRRQATVWRM